MNPTPNKPTRPTYLLLDEIEVKPGNLDEILDRRDEYLDKRLTGVWCRHGLELRMCPLCELEVQDEVTHT